MATSKAFHVHGRAVLRIKEFAVGAACRGESLTTFYPGRDGEVGGWNREDADNVAKAKAVCKECGVSAECLDYAIEFEEVYGIWGGLTTRERNKVRKSRAAARTSVSPTDGSVRPSGGSGAPDGPDLPPQH